MSQKGVYPYDFMDSFEKFNQRELPNKDQLYVFKNSLNFFSNFWQQKVFETTLWLTK